MPQGAIHLLLILCVPILALVIGFVENPWVLIGSLVVVAAGAMLLVQQLRKKK